METRRALFQSRYRKSCSLILCASWEGHVDDVLFVTDEHVDINIRMHVFDNINPSIQCRLTQDMYMYNGFAYLGNLRTVLLSIQFTDNQRGMQIRTFKVLASLANKIDILYSRCNCGPVDNGHRVHWILSIFWMQEGLLSLSIWKLLASIEMHWCNKYWANCHSDSNFQAKTSYLPINPTITKHWSFSLIGAHQRWKQFNCSYWDVYYVQIRACWALLVVKAWMGWRMSATDELKLERISRTIHPVCKFDKLVWG